MTEVVGFDCLERRSALRRVPCFAGLGSTLGRQTQGRVRVEDFEQVGFSHSPDPVCPSWSWHDVMVAGLKSTHRCDLRL